MRERQGAGLDGMGLDGEQHRQIMFRAFAAAINLAALNRRFSIASIPWWLY